MRAPAVLALCGVAGASFGDVTVRSVSLKTSDLALDPVAGMLYASVPGAAGGGRANSVTPINPSLATLGTSIPVGLEPHRLAIAGNGQYLYVGLDGEAAVRRVNLPTQSAELQFTLGSNALTGPFYAEDIEVMPGAPQTVAVSRRNQGFSPRHEGVAIYDNGVRRSATTARHSGSNMIEFGASAATLYGIENESTNAAFRTMSVSASGVTITKTTFDMFNDFTYDIVYDGSMVISTSGRAINPVTHTVLGEYGMYGSVVSEPAANHVYFLSGGIITVKNRTTFTTIGTIPVPGASSLSADLVRWGADGLAFRDTGLDRVYLVNSPLIPAPSVLGPVAAIALAARSRRRSGRYSPA